MEPSKYKSTPITELSNETTVDIDLSDSKGIVRLLRQCDAQIFSGWRDQQSLYDVETLEPLENLSNYIKQALQDPDNYCVVFSGCGTSGRIGFMMARKFNSLAVELGTSGMYRYIIAGRDTALFSSVELPEDDWYQGQRDLQSLVKDKKKVVFIGITCGLSAPYVAGQLNYCMDNPDIFVPVLLGFNPIHLARKTIIEGCNKTFFDVAKRLSEHNNGIIINPVIGPEAITGSSRMKGGSATKILIETALIKAHSEVLSPGLEVHPYNIFPLYQSVFRETYLDVRELSKAVSFAGDSLSKGQHVYYLSWGSPSFTAVLDASECVPTFSASFYDVRAFIKGGFTSLGITDAIEVDGFEVKISIDHFTKDILPTLTKDDTVICICACPNLTKEADNIVQEISKKGVRIVGLLSKRYEARMKDLFDVCFQIDNKISNNISLPNKNVQEFLSKCLDEMSVKLILNALSTGGHVLKGKILRSLMIDVKVSNNKLFRRAIGIISELCRVAENEALTALLKAIYRCDVVPESIRKDVISRHISVGTQRDRVVPLAVLLASGRYDVEFGLKALEKERIAHLLKELHLI